MHKFNLLRWSSCLLFFGWTHNDGWTLICAGLWQAQASSSDNLWCIIWRPDSVWRIFWRPDSIWCGGWRPDCYWDTICDTSDSRWLGLLNAAPCLHILSVTLKSDKYDIAVPPKLSGHERLIPFHLLTVKNRDGCSHIYPAPSPVYVLSTHQHKTQISLTSQTSPFLTSISNPDTQMPSARDYMVH